VPKNVWALPEALKGANYVEAGRSFEGEVRQGLLEGEVDLRVRAVGPHRPLSLVAEAGAEDGPRMEPGPGLERWQSGCDYGRVSSWRKARQAARPGGTRGF